MARRPRRYLAPAVAALLLLAGCGDASPESPPTGVDELVIPTPSPDPGDFVGRIDNPWLPLTPGARWTYEVSGADDGDLVVEVEDATYVVEGIDTTPVSRTGPTGDQVVDYYAQDRAGNVWWFGREGVWLAGKDGAEAGLAMPANPRVGDGWRAAYGAGVVDVAVTVVTLDQTVTTPAGRFEGVLTLDVKDELEADADRRVFYRRGIGPVQEVSSDGPVYVASLTAADGTAG